MRKRLIPFTVVAVLILLAGPARADLITLNHTSGLSWDVVVQNVPPGTVVGGFDIDIGFNPLAVSPNNVSFGLLLGDPALFEAITGEGGSPGVWNIFEVSLLPVFVLSGLQPSGTFVLATITFDQVGTEPIDLTVLRAAVSDGWGEPITEAQVPEPGTMILLGSGLAALARWRKKLV